VLGLYYFDPKDTLMTAAGAETCRTLIFVINFIILMQWYQQPTRSSKICFIDCFKLTCSGRQCRPSSGALWLYIQLFGTTYCNDKII